MIIEKLVIIIEITYAISRKQVFAVITVPIPRKVPNDWRNKARLNGIIKFAVNEYLLETNIFIKEFEKIDIITKQKPITYMNIFKSRFKVNEMFFSLYFAIINGMNADWNAVTGISKSNETFAAAE